MKCTSLPDPTFDFPGVYAGTFIQSNGHSLTVRDICRLANVLISEQKLKNVIVGRKMGNKTFEGAKLLGVFGRRSWRK